MSTVCVLGSFMMDLVVRADRRPALGETVVGDDFEMTLGGKGFNQAVAAARAGADTAMIGRLGNDDFGQAFWKVLDSEGVNRHGVTFDAETGTGVGLPVGQPDGQNSIIIVPRANSRLEVAGLKDTWERAGHIDVLLIQLELPIELTMELARCAKETGTTVVLNPAPAYALSDELLNLVDVLIPNEVELSMLVTTPGLTEKEQAEYLRDTFDLNVIVTLGDRGSLILPQAGGIHEIASHRVEAIDTVGAGDTFCGYLGAHIARGDHILDAARRANAAAAISVTRRGSATSVPSSQEVADLLANTSAAIGVQQH